MCEILTAQRNSLSKLAVQFPFEMKRRLRFPTSAVLVHIGWKNNVSIQMWVEFGKLQSFCVRLILFNAIMVLSHFIGFKPFLGGTHLLTY